MVLYRLKHVHHSGCSPRSTPDKVYDVVRKGHPGLIPTSAHISLTMFIPAATRAVRMEFCTTPSGQEVPLNSEFNRTKLAAAYLADGDSSMTNAMCGFYLQAMALDTSGLEFEEAQTVAHRLYATYPPMEMHFAIAAALRIKAEHPEVFRSIAAREIVILCPDCLRAGETQSSSK